MAPKSAFSELARLQMADPMGMIGELNALEDMLNVAAPPQAAIGNGIEALGDYQDPQGGAPTVVEQVPDEIEDDFEDLMSEPTENEKRERQSKLDHDSAEFLQATGVGVLNGMGEELYSDDTWRPQAARTRPTTPPVPQQYQMATGNTTPRSKPSAEPSPDLTPKRQRLADAEAVDEVLSQAAAALEYEPVRRARVSKTLGKVSPRIKSPRSSSSASGLVPKALSGRAHRASRAHCC